MTSQSDAGNQAGSWFRITFLARTEEMMRQAAAGLGKVSPERKLDELFHLLEGDFLTRL